LRKELIYKYIKGTKLDQLKKKGTKIVLFTLVFENKLPTIVEITHFTLQNESNHFR